jgi:hypothetical protein
MQQVLFISSFIGVTLFFVSLIMRIFKKEMRIPVPLLHIWDISFTNTYVLTPAMAYQVYFWATALNVIDKF